MSASAVNVYEKIRKAKQVACPIVSLATSDPAAAAIKIAQVLASMKDAAVIQWDCSHGATAVPADNGAYARSCSEAAKIGEEVDLHDALVKAIDQKNGLARNTVLIVHNAQRYLDRTDVIQAIWNLRDAFKNPSRMLVLMGCGIKLPAELQHDVVELDEPLPDTEELKAIASKVGKDAAKSGAKVDMSDEVVGSMAVAGSGLSAFAAEQYYALNVSRDAGFSVEGVWADKKKKINETPGLKVVSEGTFADIGGCENIKHFLRCILHGNKKPGGIVYIDEIEKAIGLSSSRDTSGVSQDQLGVLLQYMQDRRATGCIFAGRPGAAKSAIAKRAGAEGGIPTIQLDLGAMKGSLVGQSENQIRNALKVLDAVTGGNTLWLATANSLEVVPPELRRRFKYGTYYFPAPTEEERQAIWAIYLERFGLELSPDSALREQDWTGAEIEACCEIADRTGMALEDAAAYIVPVAMTAGQQIEALEAAADGRWISASYRGVYRRGYKPVPKAERQFELAE